MCFYFPIRTRLSAFLRIPGFRQLLEYEYSRPRPHDANIMTDIYDGSVWKDFMGPPSSPCSRIGLQGCTDGFQAHKSGSLSLKPVMYANMSLPPALRFKTEYMMLHIILPSNAKTYGLKKYFDFAATFELNALYHTGFLLIILKYFLNLCITTPINRRVWHQGQDFQFLNGHTRQTRTTRYLHLTVTVSVSLHFCLCCQVCNRRRRTKARVPSVSTNGHRV